MSFVFLLEIFLESRSFGLVVNICKEKRTRRKEKRKEGGRIERKKEDEGKVRRVLGLKEGGTRSRRKGKYGLGRD